MGAFVETEAATAAAEMAADTGSAAAAGDRGQGGRCRGAQQREGGTSAGLTKSESAKRGERTGVKAITPINR